MTFPYSKQMMGDIMQIVEQSETVTVVGVTPFDKSVVAVKQDNRFTYYPGSPKWFLSSPVDGNIMRMVEELNAVKLVEY